MQGYLPLSPPFRVYIVDDHKLVAESNLSLQKFEDLDAYIAHLPKPTEAPRAPRPSPEMAVAIAAEMGLGPERVLACFC